MDAMVTDQDVSFRHPFTMLVVGPTGSGKTLWIRDILCSQLITPFPKNIVWFYGEWQPLYDQLKQTIPCITFVKGLPTDNFDAYFTPQENLFVIDDLMSETNTLISDLFTKGSHHRNLSVILVLQNLFSRGKNNVGRTISLNSHYIAMFKNPRDELSLSIIARQIAPTRTQFIHDAFRHATARPYGYLLFDFKPDTRDELRYRTNVLPFDEEHMTIYIPRT